MSRSVRNISGLTFWGFLPAPLAALHAADRPKPADNPNILCLLAEDLRWDALEMMNLADGPADQDRLRQLRQ